MLDGLDGGWRGHDFLSQIREVCRLRTDQNSLTRDAEIIERSRWVGGAEFDHLVVRYTRGPWIKELVVGVCDGPANAEAVARFRDAVCAHVPTAEEPELMYRGEPANPGLDRVAQEQHIWLRIFAEYQHVWEHHSYLAVQTQENSELVPVLVTMRELAKGRILGQLLAQHMTGWPSAPTTTGSSITSTPCGKRPEARPR